LRALARDIVASAGDLYGRRIAYRVSAAFAARGIL
jgi:hypothetical protein